MDNYQDKKQNFYDQGFTIVDNFFSLEEVDFLLRVISEVDTTNPAFRRTNDLFAIRQFLKVIPKTCDLIFTDKFQSFISQFFGSDYFVVKSIYFDKPEQSNWFVAYHQDLTISVDKRIDVPGFSSWTVKQNQFAVQPPLNILENNFTIRIHLDDTDQNNGALRVIPKSHLKGIQRVDKPEQSVNEEMTCCVTKGGMMIMRPLLFHASSKTTNNNKRRVIHIEFSNSSLPDNLQWSELCNIT